MNQSADELVQQHITQAAEFIAVDALDSFKWRLPLRVRSLRLKFDSPLEEIFYLWWMAYGITQSDLLHSFKCADLRLTHHEIVDIGAQRFELDFGVDVDAPYRDNLQRFAIELDGHEFHERTRAQVQRRDYRDRALQQIGWKVFHFSFAEFVADPQRCVSEVFDFVSHIACTAYQESVSLSDEALMAAAAHTRI